MTSDFLLLQKIRNGNNHAGNQFVEKYYSFIYQYCFLHIHNQECAEDMVQETFVRFFGALMSGAEIGKAKSYLYSIAGNIIKNYYKKKKEILLDQLPDIEKDNLSEIEIRIDVERALDLLPEEIKETAILFFFQGLKQKEISDAFYKSRTDSRGITVPSYIDQMVAAVNKNSTLTPTQKQQQIAKIRKAKVNISTISRPFPNVDKSGKIDNTPKVTEFKPTGKSNGKVILLNEGHGGFTGSAFDGGAYSFQERPKGSNTYYPIEELQIVKPYSRDLTKKLQAKGYTVVTFAGEVTNMANRQLVQKLTAKYTKKFGQNNAMLISLHSDSGTSKGSGVLYDKRDAKDTALATSINKALNKQSWISAKPAERPYEEVDTKTKQKKLTHSLYVLTKSHGIPSNLLEIEYLGGVRSLNLTSSAYRKQFVNGTLEGIENYFKSAH